MVYKAIQLGRVKYAIMTQEGETVNFFIVNSEKQSIRPATEEEEKDLLKNPRTSMDDINPVLDCLSEIYALIEKLNSGLQNPRK